MSHLDDLFSIFASTLPTVPEDVHDDSTSSIKPEQELPSTSQASQVHESLKTLEDLGIRRKAIIDVPNVMHMVKNASATANAFDKNQPDAYGILNLVSFFTTREFDVELVMPGSYLDNRNKNAWILKVFQRLGLITIARSMNDDRVALELARCTGGFIVTNDKFRDHKDIENFKDVFVHRLVSLNIKKIKIEEQMEILRDHNKGRYFTGFGIGLNPKNMAAFFCSPDDPMYEVVAHIRCRRSQRKVQAIIAELNVMADYIQQELCEIYGVPKPRLDYFDPRLPLGYYKDFRSHAQSAGLFKPATDEELCMEAKRLYS